MHNLKISLHKIFISYTEGKAWWRNLAEMILVKGVKPAPSVTGQAGVESHLKGKVRTSSLRLWRRVWGSSRGDAMRTPTKGHSLCEVTAPSSSRPQESQKDGEHSRLRETAGRWAESGGGGGGWCVQRDLGTRQVKSVGRTGRPRCRRTPRCMTTARCQVHRRDRPSRRLAAPGAAASDGHAARPRPWRFQARGARTPRTATGALPSPLQLPETSPKPGCARSPSPSGGTGAGRDTRTPGFSPPVAGL